MSLTPVALMNTVETLGSHPRKEKFICLDFLPKCQGVMYKFKQIQKLFFLVIFFFRERGRLPASKLIDELFCMASLSRSLMCFVL